MYPADTIFNPILPLLENSTVVSDTTAKVFLDQQVRTMTSAIEKVKGLFSPSESSGNIVSVDEASIFLFCLHLKDLNYNFDGSIGYIENRLGNHNLFEPSGNCLHREILTNSCASITKSCLIRFCPKAFLSTDSAPKS